MLKASATDVKSKVSVENIRRIAFSGDCLASGIIALESLSMGTSHSEWQGVNSVYGWRAMAGLHRAVGDGDAALLAVSRAFPEDEKTYLTLKAQLAGEARKVAKFYKQLKQKSSTKESPECRFWSRERVRCAERLGEWTLAFNAFDDKIKADVKDGEWHEISNTL